MGLGATYDDMVRAVAAEPTAEMYQWAIAVARGSHNLTRQGRVNVLRDLRDAYRASRKGPRY